MPKILTKLKLNRVDLCKEGCNSEAHILLVKTKPKGEETNMTPDEILKGLPQGQADVLKSYMAEGQKKAVDDAVKKAVVDMQATMAEEARKKEEEKKKAEMAKKEPKDNSIAQLDETETMKSLPAELRAYVESVKKSQESAAAQAKVLETEIAKMKEAKAEEVALAKAATLKALPVETAELVSVIKGATPEVLAILEKAAKAVEGHTLVEVGKSGTTGVSANDDAWGKMDAAASEIAKTRSISHAAAIEVVVKEQPELYKAYLEGVR